MIITNVCCLVLYIPRSLCLVVGGVMSGALYLGGVMTVIETPDIITWACTRTIVMASIYGRLLALNYIPIDQKFRFELPKILYADPARRTDLAQFLLGNISRQYLFAKMLNNNDEVAVVSAVSCLMRRNLTRIHDYFKQVLQRYLPDRLKNYLRII